MWDTKLKLIDTDNSEVVTSGKGVGGSKGAECVVMEDDLTLSGAHTMRYTDHVS